MNIKLTPHDRRLILELAQERQWLRKRADDLSNASLARKFEVTECTIQKLTNSYGLGRKS